MTFNDDLYNMLMGTLSSAPKARNDYVRAPFGWPGGKWHSLDQLTKLLPQRGVWVDACGGSGIVTLNRHASDLEVFNDRHSGVIAFYRCIRDYDKMRAMIQRLSCVLHSREEWTWCKDTWSNCNDDVERASRWYYMLRTSFSQIGRAFGRSTSGTPQQAKAIGNSLKLFPHFHERFRLVQIENLDACQCIRDYDSHNTVTYVDPDYMDTDAGMYHHSVDHNALIDTIRDCRGFVALSGYANQLYDSQKFWDDRQEWQVMVSSKGLAFNEESNQRGRENVVDRGKQATEVIWIKESK